MSEAQREWNLEAPQLAQALRREQIPYLYHMTPTLIGALVAATVIVALAHRELLPAAPLLLWLAVLACVFLARLLLWRLWLRAGERVLEPVWLLRFRASVVITGIVWGAGGVMLFGSQHEEARALLAMALAGMGAASTSAMAIDRTSAFAFMLMAIPPQLLCLLHEGSSMSLSLALLLLLGSCFVSAGCVRTHRHIVENIKLRLETSADLQTQQQTVARVRAGKLHLDQRNRELEQANQEAQQLSAAKSSFLANVSHEIRSPLAAILGYSERALRADADAADMRKALGTTQRSARYLLQLVDDVLDAAQLSAGRLRIECLPTDFLQVYKEALELVQPAAAAKGLKLEQRLLWPLPECVDADPMRLKQVLMNLLDNAIKFSDHGHVRLEVSADASRQRLAIVVADCGIGITPEQQQSLFQPFAQGDASHSRRHGGTGLGLYISAELMRRMGGTLEVEASAASGSRLRLELPVGEPTCWRDAPPAGTAAAAAVTPAMAGLSGHVLLAEDDAFLRELIETLLADAGLRCTSVADGRAAVDAARAGDFDLILMDMHMPVLDGRAATAELRRSHYDAPIIALTADMLPASIAAHLQAGCTAVLGKPLASDELHALLATHLGRRHLPAPTCTVELGLARARLRFQARCRAEWPELARAAAAGERALLTSVLTRYQDTARTLDLLALQRVLITAEQAARQSPAASQAALQRVLEEIEAL